MTEKGHVRSQWFLDGQPCPKCGQVHEPDRCAGHAKATGKPCRAPHILGGTVCYHHGGATQQAKKGAKQRVAVAEVRGFLARLGEPETVDYLQALERLLFRKSAMVEALTEQVQTLRTDELVWGTVERSKKTGGEDWGKRKVEKAGLNPWVQWLHTAERDLLAIIAQCDKAGMTQKRREYLEQVGGTVALSMKAHLGLIAAFLAQMGIEQEAIFQLEANGPDFMTKALLTLDPSQQLPGGN